MGLMHFAAYTELFTLGGIPMVGNLDTGGIIGLTPEGAELCQAMATRNVSQEEVPASCVELVKHLSKGGYLEPAHDEHPRRIRSAYLHVTQRCNLSCAFCYSADENRNALPDPTFDELATSIDLLASLGANRLVISGGEPFLRSDLADIAQHAKDRSITEITVLTNGTVVAQESLSDLVGLVDCIAVAFDGTSADAPAHLRGAQNFNLLVQSVGAITEAGIKARILPTLHGKNVDDITAYHLLAEQLGTTLSFSLLTAPQSKLGTYTLANEQLTKLGEVSASEALSCEDDVAIGDGTPHLAARRFCGAGVTTLSVAADGTVYPCHMLHNRRFAMGNAFRDSADAILESSVAQRFRTLDARTFESCGTCNKRVLCGGGCRARVFLATESLTACDPYCELSSSYYDSIGQQLASRFERREPHVV